MFTAVTAYMNFGRQFDLLDQFGQQFTNSHLQIKCVRITQQLFPKNGFLGPVSKQSDSVHLGLVCLYSVFTFVRAAGDSDQQL